MDKTISTGLKNLMIVHTIFSAAVGAALWLAPGRVFTSIGWVWQTDVTTDLTLPGATFIDSILIRFLGAAMLALAFASFRARQMSLWKEVALLIQLKAIFWILGAVGTIYALIRFDFGQGLAVRIVAAVIWTAFAVAWGAVLGRYSRS